MENIILEDYASWKVENDNFIKKTQESSIIDRIEDVIKVVDFLYEKAISTGLVAEEDNIFKVGFEYLSDEIEVLKENFKIYCDEDVEKLLELEVMINLIMYIDDVTAEIINHTDDNSYSNLFGDLLSDIDRQLKEEVVDLTIVERFNERMEKYSKQLEFEYIGVIQIFSEISDLYNL